MAIGVTVLTENGSATDATSYTTASVTPTAYRLQLLTVLSGELTANPGIPSSITGNGLTWTQVATQNRTNNRVTVFRAMGSAPTAGTIVIDFGAGNTQGNCLWQLAEFDSVDVMGTGGSNAVVQSTTANATGTAISATLTSSPGTLNATVGCLAVNSTTATVTLGGQFAEIGTHGSITNPSNQRFVEWDNTSPATTVNATSSGTFVWALVALELKEAIVVFPSGIASGEGFGSTTVVNTTGVSPSSITSAEAFGSLTITNATQFVSLSGIGSAEAIGSLQATVGPTFRDVAGTASTTISSTVTISKPATVVDGDLMLAFLSTQSSITTTPPAGWTLVLAAATPTVNNAGSRLAVYYRVASSEGASYQWTLSTAGAYAASIVAYYSTDQIQPVDLIAAATTSDLLTATAIVAPSLTTTMNGPLLVTGHGSNPLSSSVTPVTFTPSAGMTERYDSSLGSPDGIAVVRASLEISDVTITDPIFSATGARTATVSNDGRNVGIALLVRPSGPVLQGVSVTGIASAEAVGTDTHILQAGYQQVTATGIASAEAFGTTRAALSPTYKASSSAQANVSKTIALTKPTPLDRGDVMLAFIVMPADATIRIVPPGWSLIRMDVTPTTTNGGARQYAYYKVVGTAAESTTYQWTLSKATDIAAGIVSYSGVDNVTPFDVQGAQTNDLGTATTVVAPAVTTSVTDAMLVTAHGVNPNTTLAGPFPMTPPSTMTERVDITVDNDPVLGATQKAVIEINDEILGAPGDTGTRTATLTSNDGRNVGQSIVLIPGSPPDFEEVFPLGIPSGAAFGFVSMSGGVPIVSQGCMIGWHASGSLPYSQYASDAAVLGKGIAAPRIFNQWNSLDPNIQLAVDDGKLVLSSHKGYDNGTNTGWADIAAGLQDSRIDELADIYKAYGREIIFIFHHEPHDEASDVGSGSSPFYGTSTDYIAAFRRIVTRFRARTTTNVRMGYCATTPHIFDVPVDKLYPGDAYIDILCHDKYNYADFRGPGGVFESFQSMMTPFVAKAVASDKKLFFAEFGCHPSVATYPANPNHDRDQWFRDAATYLKTDLDASLHVVGVAYFHIQATYDWRFASGPNYPDGLQGWLDSFTADSYFKGTPFSLVPQTKIEMAGIGSSEAFGSPTVSVGTDWWSLLYHYRRKLTVTPDTKYLPSGQIITVEVPAAIVSQGKLRTDLADLEVISYEDSAWRRLGREVTQVGTALQVRFQLTKDVVPGQSRDYFIYYGNKNGSNTGRQSFVDNPWPVKIDKSDVRITYTRPQEHWQGGVTRVRGARATLEFFGIGIRGISTVGPTKAKAEVQLDDGEWQEVDLFSPATFETEVFKKEDLAPTLHKLRFRASGRSNPSSIGDEIDLLRLEYVAVPLVEVFLEEVNVARWAGGAVGAG